MGEDIVFLIGNAKAIIATIPFSYTDFVSATVATAAREARAPTTETAKAGCIATIAIME